MRAPRLVAMAACALALSAPCRADRPRVTGDADVMEPGDCKLESWVRGDREGGQAWSTATCGLANRLEAAFGGAVERRDGALRLRQRSIELKAGLKPLEAGQWGIALQWAREDQRGGDDAAASDVLSLPFTRVWGDKDRVLHLNVGVRHDRRLRRGLATWAVAGEARVNEQWRLVAETVGESRSRPFSQLGLIYTLLADRLFLDASVGSDWRSSGAQRWVSFGMRLQADGLLR